MSEPPGDDTATLQSRLEEVAEDSGDAGVDAVPASLAAVPPIADPVALLRHLDVSGRFHRDGRLGRLFHPGMVSLREDVPTDSLHVSVHDNRLTAHVDEVSPLAVRAQGGSRYSARRAVAHNLTGMTQDLVSLLRGREGDHRCELNCEWVTDGSAPDEARLLDPGTSAWSVQLEARVKGSLDEARLRTALGTVAGGRKIEREWLEVLECEDDAALDAARSRLYAKGVPVTRFPPLHVHLARHPDGDVLMLNLNHAAADGFGALRVLEAVARAYADPADPGVALDFLASRDLPVKAIPAVASLVVRCYESAVARLGETLTPPAGLARDEASDDPSFGFHLVSLSEQQAREVEDDVLLAALHLAIGDWNRRHEMPGGRIGVLVPADLRSADLPPDVVGNFSVNARMSTGRRSRARPSSALKAIAKKAARNKRARTGTALIAGLERSGMLPLWAKQSRVVLEPLAHNRFVDTALLCDLGRLDDPPQFGPDAGETCELWFSAPARSPLCLCVGAVTVGGRLHLTLRYPHRVFGPAGAARFAECFLAHVRRVAGCASA